MGYADRVRKGQQKAAQDALAQKGDPREFIPGFGSFRVRLLPPRDMASSDPASIDYDQLFYHAHSYHFANDSFEDLVNNSGKGKYLYTLKKYTVDGIVRNDPFDDFTRAWYAQAEKTKDDTLKTLAGRIKRKRRYVCPVIMLDETDPKKKLRLLVDTTNKGDLMKLLCTKQGLPFYRDFEDNWVDKDTTKVFEKKKYHDLLDIEAGYDITIVKTKTGKENWDISFEDTFVEEQDGPRPLTAEERALLGERFDIRTYIPYETDYTKVRNALINIVGAEDVALMESGGSYDASSPSGTAPAQPRKSTLEPPAAQAAPAPQIQRQVSASASAPENDDDAPGVADILAALNDDSDAQA